MVGGRSRTRRDFDSASSSVLDSVDRLSTLANHSPHVVVWYEVLFNELAFHVDAARNERPDPLGCALRWV